MGISICVEDRKCNFVGEIPNNKFGIKKNKKNKNIINFERSLLFVKSDIVRRKEKKILSLKKKVEKLERDLNNLNK
jgi:hypothetical protein